MRQRKQLSWTYFALAQVLTVCSVGALLAAQSSGPFSAEIDVATVKAIHDKSWSLTRQPAGSHFVDEHAQEKIALRHAQQASVALKK